MCAAGVAEVVETFNGWETHRFTFPTREAAENAFHGLCDLSTVADFPLNPALIGGDDDAAPSILPPPQSLRFVAQSIADLPPEHAAILLGLDRDEAHGADCDAWLEATAALPVEAQRDEVASILTGALEVMR